MIAVEVLAALKVCVAPATPVPDTPVVMFCAAQPLVPAGKANVPTPPLLILVSVTVGSLVLVKVQAMLVSAAPTVSVLPASPDVPVQLSPLV